MSFKLNVFSIKNWFFFSLLSVMRFLVNYSVTSLFAFIKSENYNQPQLDFFGHRWNSPIKNGSGDKKK